MARRASGFVVFRKLDGQIQYLLLRASYGDKHWSSPKGHVDPGEDDFTTAVRETMEETGYREKDLIIYKNTLKTLAYDVKGKPKHVTYWLARLRDPHNAVVLSKEHTDMRWLCMKEAIATVGFADNQKMIEEYDNIIVTLD